MAGPLVRRALEAPVTGGATGVKVTEPGSGIARPVVENGEVVSYGNGCETVIGASGSFFSRKSDHAA